MRLVKKLILLSCLFFLPALPALAGESLVNSEIDVDVTGKDAADARAQAMAKGEIDALVDLLNKLATPTQAQKIINDLDAHHVSDMVKSTEVQDEKISNNRYRAHLIVTFDGDVISSMIGKVSATGADAEPTPIGSFLVIPAYEEDGSTLLWEESNPWRATWKDIGLAVTTGDIIVPFGDNKDIQIVNARTIPSANYAALAPLMIRYGVSDIVVLQGKFTRNPDMQFDVVKRHISRSENEVNLLSYRADPQETKEMLLVRAAQDIADILQHKKTEEMQSKTGKGGEKHTVMVLASITTMASWTQLKAKLSELPMIDRLELLAMSPQQVDMAIHYRGSPDSLSDAIKSKNIRLVKNANYWVISRD